MQLIGALFTYHLPDLLQSPLPPQVYAHLLALISVIPYVQCTLYNIYIYFPLFEVTSDDDMHTKDSAAFLFHLRK
jgi:hypothetical protein